MDEEMKGSRDWAKKDQISKSSSLGSLPVVLDLEDFKGDFSFDALFGTLVNELLPSFQEKEADSSDRHGNIAVNDVLPSGGLRIPTSDASKSAQPPLFPELDALLSLFKDSSRELLDLQQQIHGKLYNLKREVSVQDSKHCKTLAELEKGVDGLFDSYARLDSRMSSIGLTAAEIGDHLQSADAQQETATQTIKRVKYLMEFRTSPSELMELSPQFLDDRRVTEAA